MSDVVGLGKTYTALMVVKRHLLETGYKQPVLIITPPAIKQNWIDSINFFDEDESENRKLFPHITLTTIGCLDADFSDNLLNDESAEKAAIDDFDSTFTNDDYGMIVVDESHRFRNDGTIMYQKLDKLIGDITFRLERQPYVEAKKLKHIASVLKNWYKVYSGTADLSIYFTERGMNLLKENGILSLITTNKFFNTEYGKPVRSFIGKKCIMELINFEQVEVFENVLVSSVILILQNKDNIANNEFVYEQFYKMKADDFKEAFVEKQGTFGSYAQKFLTENEWSFCSSAELQIKVKMEKGTVRIKNLEGVYVYRGVTTGYNPAFIISDTQRDSLIKADSHNAKIIKNILQGRNIRKWYYNESSENLLQTGFDTNVEKDFSLIFQHLLQFKSELIIRADQGKNWYNLRACKYYGEFERPEKIIWGLTADKWAFTLDTERHYLPSNGYIMTSDTMPIRFLLGLLNSKALHHYFGYIGIMTAGGAYTLKAATIEALPIPAVTLEQQMPVIALVDKILATKKRNPVADTSALEAQTDSLVYKLYDLTDEEIAVVEGK